MPTTPHIREPKPADTIETFAARQAGPAASDRKTPGREGSGPVFFLL
jgi:hypothetical protein